jgi:ferredoxin-NADP reductase
MLRYIADEGLPHRVTLVYSARELESAPFVDELQELERANANFRLVLTMTDDPSWEGESRRIGADLLRDRLDEDLAAYTYYVAGPPGMVNGVVEELGQADIPEEQIRPDRFSGY